MFSLLQLHIADYHESVVFGDGDFWFTAALLRFPELLNMIFRQSADIRLKRFHAAFSIQVDFSPTPPFSSFRVVSVIFPVTLTVVTYTVPSDETASGVSLVPQGI